MALGLPGSSQRELNNCNPGSGTPTRILRSPGRQKTPRLRPSLLHVYFVKVIFVERIFGQGFQGKYNVSDNMSE